VFSSYESGRDAESNSALQLHSFTTSTPPLLRPAPHAARRLTWTCSQSSSFSSPPSKLWIIAVFYTGRQRERSGPSGFAEGRLRPLCGLRYDPWSFNIVIEASKDHSCLSGSRIRGWRMLVDLCILRIFQIARNLPQRAWAIFRARSLFSSAFTVAQ
jgi:hypothetical protein